MRFVSEDNGNCRVYYRESNRLFCWQDDGAWGKQSWKFYVCSRDGEPSHEVPEPVTPPCPGNTLIGRSLNAFLQTRQEGRAWQSKGTIEPNGTSPHPIYTVADWQYEIANGDTRRGYSEWVASKIEEAEGIMNRENPYILIYGDVVDGFTFVGPFKTRDDAITYGEVDGGQWVVAELLTPAEEAEG